MSKQLKTLGCEISVITTCREIEQEGVKNVDGIEIYSIYTNYHERWRAWLSLYNPQTILKVKKLLKDLKPDIVHAHNLHYYLSYYCLKLSQKSGAKVFLSAHDVMLFDYGKLNTKIKISVNDLSCQINYQVSWWQQLKVNRWRFNPFRNLFIKYCLRSVEKIFAVSEMLKEALQINGISRPIEVVRNSIDLKDWLSKRDLEKKFIQEYNLENKKIILFVGHPSITKGIKQLLLAFKEIYSQQSEIILLIVGAYNSIEKLINDLQLNFIKDQIIVVDWVSPSSLSVVYHVSQVVVMPSICFDTFGLVTGEAMAGGRPVVVSCLAGISDLVKKTGSGLVVNPFNLKQLSQAIEHFLIDKNEADRVGGLGQMAVQEYLSLNKTTALILAEYKRVLNS